MYVDTVDADTLDRCASRPTAAEAADVDGAANGIHVVGAYWGQ